MVKKRINYHVFAMVTGKVKPRTVTDVLLILEGKRDLLVEDIDAAEKGPRGGGSPRGFQTQGRTHAETFRRGLYWLTNSIDKDFRLPVLHWWYEDLVRLKVAGLPPWTGKPQDETTALHLLNEMISACQAARTDEVCGPLLDYAARELKGDERKAVEVLCSKNGNLALADFALEIGWDSFNDGQWRMVKKISRTKNRVGFQHFCVSSARLSVWIALPRGQFQTTRARFAFGRRFFRQLTYATDLAVAHAACR
jgi:hypothetical protein